MRVVSDITRRRIVVRLKPLKGLLIFLLLASAIIGLWKLFRIDDLLYSFLMPFQNFLISLQAPATHWIITKVFLVPSTFQVDTLIFNNGQALQEQPLCTALKQVFQMTLILLIYPGPWKHKLWYIPVSSLLLMVAAVIHLVILSLTLAKSPNIYPFIHLQISRWFFFGIYFLIWLFWEERLSWKSSSKSF